MITIRIGKMILKKLGAVTASKEKPEIVVKKKEVSVEPPVEMIEVEWAELLGKLGPVHQYIAAEIMRQKNTLINQELRAEVTQQVAKMDPKERGIFLCDVVRIWDLRSRAKYWGEAESWS